MIQYFYPSPSVASSLDLQYLQLDSIANYSTTRAASRCNAEADIRPPTRAVPVYNPLLEWHCDAGGHDRTVRQFRHRAGEDVLRCVSRR